MRSLKSITDYNINLSLPTYRNYCVLSLTKGILFPYYFHLQSIVCFTIVVNLSDCRQQINTFLELAQFNSLSH